jgi:hypothetical protein
MVVSQAMISADINKEFDGTEYEHERKLLANRASELAKEWVAQHPIDFNSDARPAEKRRKRRQNKIALQQYLHDKLSEEQNSVKMVDGRQVVGFGILTTIFITILSSILSWAIKKFLDDYYG